MEYKKNQLYNIYLKPTLFREWEIVGETEKCLIIRKDGYFIKSKGEYFNRYKSHHIPKKNVTKLEEVTK